MAVRSSVPTASMKSPAFGGTAVFSDTREIVLRSSINCLGRRVTSCTTRDAKEIAKLLAMVP